MLLDVAPLTTAHFLWFAAAFIGLYAALHWLINYRPRALRATPWRATTAYAGPLFIIAVILLTGFLLPDKSLWLALLSVGLVAAAAGTWDEMRPLSPRAQVLIQIILSALVIAGGWSIHVVSNPLGEGSIVLGAGIGTVASLVWMLLIMNAINWLDGVDGLAAGVGTVALFTLAAVALLPSVQDPLTLGLALVGAGALLGLWLWNFPPARVCLGTSGAWFLGLYIGLVAIIGGGKIVTSLLVLALPVVDLVIVIIRRLLRRQPPWQGDRHSHLHHILLNRGWSPRQIALAGTVFSLALGFAAITLQTSEKIIALFTAAAVIVLVSTRLFSPRAATLKSRYE